MGVDRYVRCQAIINIKTTFDATVGPDTVKYCLMEDLDRAGVWDISLDDIKIRNFRISGTYKQSTDLKQLVKQLQWNGVHSWGMEESGCICCGNTREDGHRGDCELYRLLGGGDV